MALSLVITTISGVALLTVFLYYVYVYIGHKYALRNFKGPLALPIVGNCYDPNCVYVIRYFASLRKRYGKVFTFFMFSNPFIVVADPIIVRRVLSDTKAFIKGREYSTCVALGLGQGLVTSNGEKHKSDRNKFSRFFVKSNIASFMPSINKACLLEIDSMNSKHQDKKPFSIDMELFFACLALRVFAGFSVGLDYTSQPEHEKHIAHLTSLCSNHIGMLVFLNLPMWDIFPQVSDIKKGRKMYLGELKAAIEKRKNDLANLKPGESAPDDCLTVMLNEKMSDKDMCDHFTTLLCAGHDTTAFFSSYFTLLLAEHPEAQEKVRQEVKEVMGDRVEVTTEDFAKFSYMQKCMQETLRLYAIIPQVTRLATEDVYIKETDTLIPKNYSVYIPMSLINRDPEIWDNPSEFNPDRFDGKGGNGDFTCAKNGFFPFGYGSRTCIGMTIAELESATFISHLLRNFRMSPEPGFRPNIRGGMSLTTSNGIRLILTPL